MAWSFLAQGNSTISAMQKLIIEGEGILGAARPRPITFASF
jgi:hypothetical protein